MQLLKKILIICSVLCLGSSFAWTQTLTGETKLLAEQKLEYRIDLPQGYNEEGPAVPVLLFLHGGDRSNTKHHPMKYARQAKLDFPFMVVAPQCGNGCSWSATDFDALLRQVLKDYNADRSRIYVTGYSFGGYGTWSAITRFPQWFAAAAPIAGGGNEKTICKAQKCESEGLPWHQRFSHSLFRFGKTNRSIEGLRRRSRTHQHQRCRSLDLARVVQRLTLLYLAPSTIKREIKPKNE